MMLKIHPNVVSNLAVFPLPAISLHNVLQSPVILQSYTLLLTTVSQATETYSIANFAIPSCA
jgi:hypothetical protein